MRTKNKLKGEVTQWFLDELKPLVGKTIELFFRCILFILPLGIYLTLIQYRKKASTIRNISVYTNDESTWQHIFPGFILVAIQPETFKKEIQEKKRNFQLWVSANKYIFEAIALVLIIVLLYLGGVK